MNERPYTIAEDGKSITCHACNRTSYNLNDVVNCYCAHCKSFFEVGLSPKRERMNHAAEALDLILGEDDGYVLLVLKPGANEAGRSGYHVSVVSNRNAKQIRETLEQFIATLPPSA